MKAMGGYNELELNKGREYHEGALRLNTGRNAFEYILRAKGYKKVYLPYYTCAAMLQPIHKLGIIYQFYRINEEFEPVFNYDEIHDAEAFVYTNYFGLKNLFIIKLSKICQNLIIDNSQAFYSTPIIGVDFFYSPRKFFGVPDGAYLYTDKFLDKQLEQDKSYMRFQHLLRRIDNGAEDGYKAFVENENKLGNLPLRKMSKLTHRILISIDYEKVKAIRTYNYNILHDNLYRLNKIKLELRKDQVPMVYPFYNDHFELREKLIENKVFVPKYWPSVLEWINDKTSIEYNYSNKLLGLPLSQNLRMDDLIFVSKKILKFAKGINE